MKYGLTPERTLTYLGKYMNEWIEAYPNKIKPFDNWIDQYFETKKKLADKSLMNSHKRFCKYCRNEFDETTIKTKDHVVPLSRGGLNTKENRVFACYDCNQWKADYSLEQWLKDVRRVLKKNKIKEPYTVAKLGYMISAIQTQMNIIKKNQNKVSIYKV
jgi:5-methylcytosine-specific restriction endonuclease McrA